MIVACDVATPAGRFHCHPNIAVGATFLDPVSGLTGTVSALTPGPIQDPNGWGGGPMDTVTLTGSLAGTYLAQSGLSRPGPGGSSLFWILTSPAPQGTIA